MMDKQKQIDISKVKSPVIKQRLEIIEMEKCIDSGFAEARKYKTNAFTNCIAETLYNAGYRKIPEGVAVIDRNENPCLSCPVPTSEREIADCSTICGAIQLGIDWKNQCRVLVRDYNRLEKDYQKVRKETAEKFAERLKENTVDEYDSEGVNHPYVILDYDELDEICKEFTGGDE